MLLNLVLLAAALYAGAMLVLYMIQATLIFPATRGMDRTPAALGWAYDEVRLAVGDETTHGWFLPVENARGTVLFSHGNGGNASLWLDAMDIYRDMGFNVLLYDFGGYGVSTGKASEARCYADARAMWRYLTEERGIAAERIVLIGRSLGSGVAAQLGDEEKPAAIVLESPFLSMSHMARRTVPIAPTGLLLTHRFDTQSKIARLKAPVLIVHSEGDDLVPYADGRRLFELAPEPKEFLEIRGGHNDCFFVSEVAYRAALERFLGLYLPNREAVGRG